jgi:hypothetical protein
VVLEEMPFGKNGRPVLLDSALDHMNKWIKGGAAPPHGY